MSQDQNVERSVSDNQASLNDKNAEHASTINQNNIQNQNNNNIKTGDEISEDAVLNLANSIVNSLYTENDGVAQNDETNMGTDSEDHMQSSPRHFENENSVSAVARQNEEDDDYDFEFDQEDLITNIVANAVESMTETENVGENSAEKSRSISEGKGDISKTEEAENSDTYRAETGEDDSHQQTTEETEKLRYAESKHDEELVAVPNDDLKNAEKQEPLKEDELEDVIADAFKDQFQLDSDDANSDMEPRKKPDIQPHDDNEDVDNNTDRNMDLMNAINDALVQNIENIQQSNEELQDADKSSNEEDDLNAAIVDALKKTESAVKANEFLNSNTSIGNDDLEDVIQDIDLNNVMQSALHENEDDKENDYDANLELNTAIKEALMTVPKKSSDLLPKRKNNHRVSFLKDKLDLSTELTNVISNALKESGLVNRETTNEFDIEAALKEVVSGVIEHNLVTQSPQRVEKEAEKEVEKEADYNWDDIMDNAFEMAMEYPNDLRFDVDEHDHENLTASKYKLDFGLKKDNRGKITKKTTNRQHLLVPQSKPTGSLTRDLKNRFPLPIAPSKISAIATVTSVLDSLKLEEIDVNDVFRLKAAKLDAIKRNVSSVLSSLINSTSTNIKDQTPKDQLDEKDKLRLENRERKKRWREFNIERNRDIDLKTRVLKRANHLYPSSEHDALKKEWVESEFKKRKQKRLEREQKKNFNMIDIRNFDANDVLPFDSFFKNKNNLSKIVEIYNEMGGMVTEDKLLSSSADRTASVTSIATVIAASYLVEKEKNQFTNINHEMDEDDEYSIIQSLVVSVDKYLKNKDHIYRAEYRKVDNPMDGWDVSMSDVDETEKKVINPSINLKPMKIAPVTGGATFKVNLDDIKLVEPPSFFQNEISFNNKRPSSKMTAKFKHSGMINTFGNTKKRIDDIKQKRKTKPLVINFEKFLTPNPPKLELARKRKGSFATQIINNMEPSLKKRLADERDVMSMINNNNEFEIDYDTHIDMDSMDISNTIEDELNQLDNDTAKENLKMIEKQLNYQVQRMQSTQSDDDMSGEKVDDDALASVVNQVVGALEENYREGLQGSGSTQITIENISNGSDPKKSDVDDDDINLQSTIESAVQDLGKSMSESSGKHEIELLHSEEAEKADELAPPVKEILDAPKKAFIAEKEESIIRKKIVDRSSGETHSASNDEDGSSPKNDISNKLDADQAKKETVLYSSNKIKTEAPKRKNKQKTIAQIPQIPLPQYGIPKPTNRIVKVPTIIKSIDRSYSPVGEPSSAEENKVGGIKRPGAFRRPTAFKKPGDSTGKNITRPFGRIPSIKKL